MKQTIYGNVPSKSNCYRIAKFNHRGTLVKTAALKLFEDSFYIQCNHYRNARIEGYFEFSMDVYYPHQRSDLDNSLKVVLDCLQKIKAIRNDNRCTMITLRKFLDKRNPRIEFEIKAC